ncbi:MAG: 8-oxo-dGTP diphosphatase [Fibrobacterota bacterium]
MMNSNTQAAEIDWDTFPFQDHAVLTFIRRGNEYLLIKKLRGLGRGKFNAPGGRVEPGETIREAAVRECEEEVGLCPADLNYVTELNFLFRDGYSIRGWVFTADSFSGTLCDTDEAQPFWCTPAAMPYYNMWEDDRYWIPLMLSGKFVRGGFIFDGDRLESMTLTAEDVFPQLRESILLPE